MTSGIYKIIISKYYYIGSSNNIERRTTKHLQHLRENKHVNPFLQNVYNKHSDWKIEIVERCKESKLLEAEQKYIDEHYGKDGCLNLNPTACKPPSARGRILSEETKRKMSESKAGWIPSDEAKHNMSVAARRHHKTTPFYLVSATEKHGPFYTFKEVKIAGIMDDSSACELYNNLGKKTRKGYQIKRINT